MPKIKHLLSEHSKTQAQEIYFQNEGVISKRKTQESGNWNSAQQKDEENSH